MSNTGNGEYDTLILCDIVSIIYRLIGQSCGHQIIIIMDFIIGIVLFG